MECLSAGVNVALFSKTVISFLGDKQHGHPVIAGVTRNLFRATAIYIYQIFHVSCRTFKGQTLVVCRVRQKKRLVDWLKIGAPFHLRVFHLWFQTTQYSQSQL